MSELTESIGKAQLTPDGTCTWRGIIDGETVEKTRNRRERGERRTPLFPIPVALLGGCDRIALAGMADGVFEQDPQGKPPARILCKVARILPAADGSRHRQRPRGGHARRSHRAPASR